MQRNTDENLIIRQPQLELSDEDLRGQPGQSHARVWPPQHKLTQEETIQPPAKKEKKKTIHFFTVYQQFCFHFICFTLVV